MRRTEILKLVGKVGSSDAHFCSTELALKILKAELDETQPLNRDDLIFHTLCDVASSDKDIQNRRLAIQWLIANIESPIVEERDGDETRISSRDAWVNDELKSLANKGLYQATDIISTWYFETMAQRGLASLSLPGLVVMLSPSQDSIVSILSLDGPVFIKNDMFSRHLVHLLRLLAEAYYDAMTIPQPAEKLTPEESWVEEQLKRMETATFDEIKKDMNRWARIVKGGVIMVKKRYHNELPFSFGTTKITLTENEPGVFSVATYFDTENAIYNEATSYFCSESAILFRPLLEYVASFLFPSDKNHESI